MYFPWGLTRGVRSAASCPCLLVGISRYALLNRALRNYTLNPNLWRGRCRTILLTPLVWGAFRSDRGAAFGPALGRGFLHRGLGWPGQRRGRIPAPSDLRRTLPVPADSLPSHHRRPVADRLSYLALAVLSAVFMIYLIKLGDEMGRRYWNHLLIDSLWSNWSHLTMALVGNLSPEEVLTRLSDHLECLLEFARSRALGPEGEVMLEKSYASVSRRTRN